MSTGTEGGSMSEARARLLDTATRIFYAEGIHSVGVDRIIAEAQVTRATLYRHFKGKEELILSYLQRADHGMRGQVAAIREQGLSAPDTVRAVSRSIAEGIQSAGFRGCAFLNAAAEYPDPGHPVHRAVLDHRHWFLETATQLLEDAGCAPAEVAGRHFVMLRDGAMAAGCLSDPKPVCETFLHGVEGILRTGTASAPDSDGPGTPSA
ncbi:TetR/AcrR family transcriptional regulator [Streptomyces collinus]